MRALGLLLAVGSVWGLSFTLSRIVATGGGAPVAIAFWQCALGAGILHAAGRRPRIDRRTVPFFLVTGLLGAALPATLVYAAAVHVEAGALAVCMALNPMMTFGICAALGIERATARRLGGLSLGLAAVWLLTAPEAAGPVGWTLVAVAAAGSYACENVVLATRRPPGDGPFTTLAGILAAAALLLAPLALATGRPLPFAWPPAAPEAAFALQTFGNIAAYGGFVHLVARSGPVFASQVSFVVTAAGVTWGMALLGERHEGPFWAALATMALGLALSRPRAGATGSSDMDPGPAPVLSNGSSVAIEPAAQNDQREGHP